MNGTDKIKLDQTARKAVIYIRQSTARQVQVNEESTRRQYALKDMLIGLGWAPELIETADSDLGTSGRYSENREGFQRLVGDVANGTVGAIACIEASRLSRNNSDWARIIDFCALTNTVIIDEDGVYDPVDPNDRLLLGVKGSIAEMELHYIRARMQGGLMNKVMRGELRIRLPVGYIYDPLDRIVFDPSKDIKDAVCKFFRTFRVQGSIYGTVSYFQKHSLKFPVRHHFGEKKGEIEWMELTTDRAGRVLKNPVYCGRYAYGRSKTVTTPLKRNVIPQPEDKWLVNIRNHHPAYISEEEYEKNQERLRNNTCGRRPDTAPTIPGKGSALLQGIVYCGICGKRMNTVYQASSSKDRNRPAFPLYICDGDPSVPHSRCMQVNGAAIDEKISALVRERLTEEAVQNALEIRDEVDVRWKEVEGLLKTRLQRAEYDASIMKKRYMNCDPENALVRIELEKAYNETLSAVVEAEENLRKEIDRHAREQSDTISEKLEGLVGNFSRVWDDPQTDLQCKKKLIRHLVQNVTLTRTGKEKSCKVQVLYAGNKTDEFMIRCNFWGPESTSWQVYDVLEAHGCENTPKGLAEMLNEKGLLRAGGKKWTQNNVSQFMSYHKIKTMRQNYLEKGYLTVNEAAKIQGITHTSMLNRIYKGRYDGEYVRVTDRMILLAPSTVEKIRKH